MSRSRLGAPELTRLLRAIAEPMYILDPERQIVFVNQALINLTGLAENDLLGLECRYHSEPTAKPADALAAGLCPPPAAFERAETAGSLHGQVMLPAADGMLRTYAAEFRPLGYDDGELAAVWVVIHPQPVESAAGPSASDSHLAPTDELHERLRRHRATLTHKFDLERLVGESAVARRIRAQAHLAARSDANVLLVGPPGSGRGQLARTIHYYRGPTLTVTPGTLAPLDCAALTSELLTTTIRTLTAGEGPRRSPAAAAILLNDVDALAADAQTELAGLLARKPPSLRWYAAAQRPLADLAAAGSFRHDLACALSTLVIELPPLATRGEDLPLLAQALVEGHNARGAKQIQSFTPEALDLLAGYAWPGNLAELTEMIRAAHAAAEGSQIRANDLPAKIHLAREAALYPPRVDEPVNLADFVARLERELIERALARSRGNKTKAARLLGMTRPKFLRRLVQFGLAPAGPEEVEFELDESADEAGDAENES